MKSRIVVVLSLLFVILIGLVYAESVSIATENGEKLDIPLNTSENKHEKISKEAMKNDIQKDSKQLHVDERPVSRYNPWSIFDDMIKASDRIMDSFWKDDFFLSLFRPRKLFAVRVIVDPDSFQDENNGLIQSIGSSEIFTDVKKLDDRYIVEAAIPGFDKSEVNIFVNRSKVQGKSILTIQGDKKAKEESGDKEHGNYILRERSSTFSRSFAFDFNINEDQIQAKYDNGVLVIEVPFTNVNTETRLIDIQ